MSVDVQGKKYTSPNGSKTWEYLAISTCSIMSGCMGFVIGWNSPSIVILMSEDSPIPVTASSISTLVAIVAFGHMLAPLINTLIVDKFGRKNTLLLSGLPVIVSWSLIIIASSIWELYVARFLAGISLGLFICVFPMYIGEISSPETRGIGGSVTTIIYNIGIFLTFAIAPYLSLSSMAGAFLAVSVAFVITFWFMPESPYFLAMSNRTDEAEEVLEKLRGKTDVSEELQAIVDSLSRRVKESAKSKGLRDMFASRANLKAILSIAMFSTIQYFGGFFTIQAYGQLIFKSISNVMSDYEINVVIGVTQVISILVTVLLVDKFGRKPLILVAGVSISICNLAIGLYFFAGEYMHEDVHSLSWIPFVASVVLVFMFNSGILCLQVILMSEIFATEIKAVSTCAVSMIAGFLATLGTKLYIWVAITLGYGHSLPFLFYSAVVATCTAIILRVTPETRGKTFAEIQLELKK
ncbi:facilitated trehalose transporter Tret1-like [Frieseomelitta varia]|uniref:facilitated trehalose transporter Tret1-like n=1 Tax=Frieseomelitta varia TaxID=561572 RepID=UPI001CB6B1E8|nr:facilitated trehalose transporter Tret1-like [Frieseomelitta varia]